MSSVAERRQLLMGAATLFYESPIEIVRGEGVELFDEAGRRYIDMYNNVPCVGHGNPVVAEAVARQMSTLQVHSRYLQTQFSTMLSGCWRCIMISLSQRCLLVLVRKPLKSPS